MSERLEIASHQGPYTAEFLPGAIARVHELAPAKSHFIIDSNIARLYARELATVLKTPPALVVEATEANKSLDRFTDYVEKLVARKVRRGDTLVAIGGGIIQDITCFIAATLLRGLDWNFFPTTLLAQADSCIGSKSSINVGHAKNMLGTYTPPKRIWIDTGVLATLEKRDIHSGIGEMLKVHIIDGPESFAWIAEEYPRLLADKAALERGIRRSLAIKQKFIEADEFDKGIRNVLNYGHSFGHAIEAATEFAIPHGIAVTMGMDLANFAAAKLGIGSEEHYRRMQPTLRANYAEFAKTRIPFEPFLAALGKDKKNEGSTLGLILPDKAGKIGKFQVPNDTRFREACGEYFEKLT